MVYDSGGGGLYVWDRGVNRKFATGAWPAWSPDDGWIAYTQMMQGLRVVKVPSEGGKEIPLANAAQSRAWSPDSRKIAFVAGSSGQREIWVMNNDGSNAHVIIARDFGSISMFPPAWSPDSLYIAFIATRDGQCNVYVATAEGKNPISIAHTSSGSKESWTTVSWSR